MKSERKRFYGTLHLPLHTPSSAKMCYCAKRVIIIPCKVYTTTHSRWNSGSVAEDERGRGSKVEHTQNSFISQSHSFIISESSSTAVVVAEAAV